MNSILRNILAVIAGVLIGGALNMGIIAISSSVIPPPEGANLKTMEGLKEAMPLMQPRHFIMPFLAHALGTLLAAFIAAKFAVSHNKRIATGIGIWFLIGGIINIILLPSPLWFTIVDLAGAYLPMALLGYTLANNKK